MMSSPALPGLFLCTAAMALLIIVSLSSPTWESISFLDVTVGKKIIHFGVFGYTGSSKTVGYTFNFQSLGLPASVVNDGLIRKLTIALILHPIAAGFSGLAVLGGVFGAFNNRNGTISMTLASTLAFLATSVVFVVDMVLWSIVRNRIRAIGAARVTAQYGNANWLTAGAMAALILGFCAGSLGSCGRYRKLRQTN